MSIEMYGVTKEVALNFWAANLREVMGDARWAKVQDPVGIYLASVLGSFCLESLDGELALSPAYLPDPDEFRLFADLRQIAELMIGRLTIPACPRWMESAGAHILLYAGFFNAQHRDRHSIPLYAAIGKECYLMAAVGKREKAMKLVARNFDEHLFYLSRLQGHLRDKRYLIH